MVSKALQTAAEQIGFTYVEKTSAKQSYLYGVYGDYLITLHDSGNQKTAFINYYLELNEDEDESVRLLELSEEMRGFAADFSVVDYGFESDGMFLTADCSTNAFLELLDEMVDLLKEKSLFGVERCSSCGNKIGKRPPKKLAVGKKNFLLCEHCALEQMELQSKGDSTEAKTFQQKTLLGVLGAIAGGVIGVLLYFVLYYFAADMFTGFEITYVFSLLGFATAFLVYKGFTFFSKQPCVSAYAIVTSVTVVCVTIGQYIGSFVDNAAAFGFQLLDATKIPAMWLILIRSTATENATVDDPSAMFYKLLCFSLLFAIIGTIIFLLGFKEKAKIKKEALELTTLRI